ncbi:hypothetical protein [Streptomyces sp. NPDC059224]|uniref:hypothetical protein n=1 Tax=Streptomyces sp. NPDC059224 TaxID=3346775 RepID=UPI0036974F7C
MPRCLGDREREALLAHERARLRCRHHLVRTMWRLTAAADPLLRPLAEAGAFVVGRWADEEVAARVGSRAVVARAVGRAAPATAGAARPAALAAAGGAVPGRVRALPAPPPSRRALPFVAGALLPALCRGGLANAASDSESLVDGAERAQCAGDARAPYAAGTGHCRQRTDDACCDRPRSRRTRKAPQAAA